MPQEQYEARYKAQEELLQGEIKATTEQVESRAAEMRRLQATVESYKLSNEELNVRYIIPVLGMEGFQGKSRVGTAC
jgi:kinesin family protein 5